jgi:protein gp37
MNNNPYMSVVDVWPVWHGQRACVGIPPEVFFPAPNDRAGVREAKDIFVDWVIVGGESGKGARPMDPQWARGLRDECTAYEIPFHFKQWGEYLPVDGPAVDNYKWVGKKAAGRVLDGRTWDEFPS